MGKLNKVIDDYTLMIVGECYEDEKKYIDMIEQNGIQNNVYTHFSFVSDEDVGTYFSASDVVVLPYKTASQSGIVQIAYHFDTPVIVSNVGGLPEIVDEGKTGYSVNPDPDSFAEAIQSFFASEDNASFSMNVAEFKKRFSWETMIETIENFANVR
jgi:glycosyltransferase involved in cell wall biosynthesis